jgi:type IV secretion system protein VirD4
VNEVRDVQNIADILVDPEGALDGAIIGKDQPLLLVGAILHVLMPKRKRRSACAKLLSDRSAVRATLKVMMAHQSSWHGRSAAVHPVVASRARELLDKSENERSGVLSTAMSFLGSTRSRPSRP